MLTYAIFVLTSIVVGAVCATYAAKRNRNPIVWFLVGAALNVVALAVIGILEKRRTSDGRG